MSRLSKKMLFWYLVSEIDISKYKQKEYVKTITEIYYNIYEYDKNKKLKEEKKE